MRFRVPCSSAVWFYAGCWAVLAALFAQGAPIVNLVALSVLLWGAATFDTGTRWLRLRRLLGRSLRDWC